MKSTRAPKFVLAGVVGLLGLGIGTTLGPATASAATSTTAAVSERVTSIKEALSGLVTDGTITQGQELDLDTAATAIGVTTDDLRTALQGGQTLAQVAQGKGIDQDTLVAKLVDAEKAEIAADVTSGDLTQAQADAEVAGLQAEITERVTSTRPAGGHGHDGDDDSSGTSSSSSSSSAQS
jgi:hypothetical protein